MREFSKFRKPIPILLMRLMRLLIDSVGPLLSRVRWKFVILWNHFLRVRPNFWISGGMVCARHRSRWVGDVRGRGLIAAVEFVANKKPAKRFDPSVRVAAHVAQVSPENGVIRALPAADAISFSPPLIVNEVQIDQMVEVARAAPDTRCSRDLARAIPARECPSAPENLSGNVKSSTHLTDVVKLAER